MKFDVLTLLPEFFTTPLAEGVIGRAVSAGLLRVRTHNIRDYTTDRHRTADDAPYGGGHGMVMKVEPVARAIEQVRRADGPARVILTTPQGVPFDQRSAERLAAEKRIVIVCGRYEGVDERIRGLVDEEVSIGDYVMTGGEAAAFVLIDSIGRLIPGVLGAEGSKEDDSFSAGLLEYPQYTRPEEFSGQRVPEVLLSGDHERIRRWRRTEALSRTLERRPELIEAAELTDEDTAILDELKCQ